MPNLDGKGPNGQGPMTGRGLGRCTTSGSVVPRPQRRGLANRRGVGFGRRSRGRGNGVGLGRGFRASK